MTRVDTFAKDRLPAPADLPEFVWSGLKQPVPQRLNVASFLLDERLQALA